MKLMALRAEGRKRKVKGLQVIIFLVSGIAVRVKNVVEVRIIDMKFSRADANYRP